MVKKVHGSRKKMLTNIQQSISSFGLEKLCTEGTSASVAKPAFCYRTTFQNTRLIVSQANSLISNSIGF